MGVAEAREHAARARHADGGDQLFAQEAERDRVEEQGALSREAEDAALGSKVEELPEIEVDGAHLRRS